MTVVSTTTIAGEVGKYTTSSTTPASLYTTLRAVQGASVEAREGTTTTGRCSSCATWACLAGGGWAWQSWIRAGSGFERSCTDVMLLLLGVTVGLQEGGYGCCCCAVDVQGAIAEAREGTTATGRCSSCATWVGGIGEVGIEVFLAPCSH